MFSLSLSLSHTHTQTHQLTSLSLSLSDQVQKQVEAEANDPDTPKLVNTRDFNKGRSDMQCALANYYGFWLKFRGKTHASSPLFD
jgi:hypothetical protein